MTTESKYGYWHAHPTCCPKGEYGSIPLTESDKRDGWTEEVLTVQPKESAAASTVYALRLALTVLRRAGKNEAANELEAAAIPLQDAHTSPPPPENVHWCAACTPDNCSGCPFPSTPQQKTPPVSAESATPFGYFGVLRNEQGRVVHSGFSCFIPNTDEHAASGWQWEVTPLTVMPLHPVTPPPAPTGQVPAEWTNLLAYVLQDDLHNRLTPRIIDIAYTAFSLAKEPNSENGGASDWFNDTRPAIQGLTAKLRKDLIEEFAKNAQNLPQAPVKSSQCTQCRKQFNYPKTSVGCPKCAPDVEISESEFQKPMGLQESSKETYKQELNSTNCMQCCVAYMLGLPLSDVPHFAASVEWEAALEDFVQSQGYALVMLPSNYEVEADYLASGATERGTTHMVVMNDGKLVHDPHPSNAGLDKIQCVWFLTKLAPRPAALEGNSKRPTAMHSI